MIILRSRIAGLSETALARFVARARRAAGLRGEVHVLVTNSREVRSLNRRFRGKDKPTDVLSFPAAFSPVEGPAGDVAISAEIAAAQARRLGHSTSEEIKVLALHGILHLAGHDHERDGGDMERKEGRLRRDLGLPVGLIERQGNAAGSRSKPKPRKQGPERAADDGHSSRRRAG